MTVRRPLPSAWMSRDSKFSCDRRTVGVRASQWAANRALSFASIPHLVYNATHETRKVLWALSVRSHDERHACRREQQVAAGYERYPRALTGYGPGTLWVEVALASRRFASQPSHYSPRLPLAARTSPTLRDDGGAR